MMAQENILTYEEKQENKNLNNKQKLKYYKGG